MEQSPPWEADSSSPSQEIPRTVCNSVVRYRIHNRPPLVTTLGHFNLAHDLPIYFFKNQRSIIFSSTSRSSKWSPSYRFLHRNPAFLFSHIQATCAACLISSIMLYRTVLHNTIPIGCINQQWNNHASWYECCKSPNNPCTDIYSYLSTNWQRYKTMMASLHLWTVGDRKPWWHVSIYINWR